MDLFGIKQPGTLAVWHGTAIVSIDEHDKFSNSYIATYVSGSGYEGFEHRPIDRKNHRLWKGGQRVVCHSDFLTIAPDPSIILKEML